MLQNPFSITTNFTLHAEPIGAVAEQIVIAIYDLTGTHVDRIVGCDTASVTWNTKELRNGAYIYIATVEGEDKLFGSFKGFV